MDAYDLKKLEELLRDFYNLTKIKICVYDHSENELCFYPEKRSSFCSLLRQDEEMDKRCKACDHHAFSECRKTREQYVYTCHAGLVECVSPILHGEKLIGYIAIGQIKTDTNTDFSLVKDNLPEALLPSLQDKFESLPTVDMDKIHSAIRILDACLQQHRHGGAVAVDSHHVQALHAGVQYLSIGIDQGNIMFFSGKLMGQRKADLSATCNNNIHDSLPIR